MSNVLKFFSIFLVFSVMSSESRLSSHGYCQSNQNIENELAFEQVTPKRMSIELNKMFNGDIKFRQIKFNNLFFKIPDFEYENFDSSQKKIMLINSENSFGVRLSHENDVMGSLAKIIDDKTSLAELITREKDISICKGSNALSERQFEELVAIEFIRRKFQNKNNQFAVLSKYEVEFYDSSKTKDTYLKFTINPTDNSFWELMIYKMKSTTMD